MKKILLCLLLAAAVSLSVTADTRAYSFSDDFNDGDLAGWTPKQGDWSNPGDHLLSSFDNYGIIWKDDSFGLYQHIELYAYFDDNPSSKSAQMLLRAGVGGGSNPYWDHGYDAYVSRNALGIQNHVAPFQQHPLGSDSSLSLDAGWHKIAFSVSSLGNDTNLRLWVDDYLYLDVYDTLGGQHDDGGYIALGSSNHLNRRIMYDNIQGASYTSPVPEPACLLLLGSGLAGVICPRTKRKGRQVREK